LINSDTIAVRPDEAFDENHLREYLIGKLDGSTNNLSVRQFGGGKANLTYLLDFGSHQYVLRRPPLGPLAPSSHDMSREYKVLSVLYKKFPYAPRALHLCENEEIIGSPFFIMERKIGTVIRKKLIENFYKQKNGPQLISGELIKTLAEFHQVDYSEIGLDDLGKPIGFVERQINGWKKRWDNAKHQEIDAVENIYAWLVKNVPNTNQFSIVHNDYKLDNVMFNTNNPGKIIAIFDWDMCTLGDPLCDLGSLLSYWCTPSDPVFFQKGSTMPIDERFYTREKLVKDYADISGYDVSNIRFYHVLGLYRLIGIAAQIYIRFLRGQTKDKRFAVFGDMINLVSRHGMELIADD
jgi:aminoglycoside phosphotransferase (APT) family kinase protein